MVTITRDDWIRALTDAGYHEDDGDQDAVTINEFQALMGIERRFTAARRLDVLVAQGRAKKTRKITYTPDGRRISALAYRLV